MFDTSHLFIYVRQETEHGIGPLQIGSTFIDHEYYILHHINPHRCIDISFRDRSTTNECASTQVLQLPRHYSLFIKEVLNRLSGSYEAHGVFKHAYRSFLHAYLGFKHVKMRVMMNRSFEKYKQVLKNPNLIPSDVAVHNLRIQEFNFE